MFHAIGSAKAALCLVIRYDPAITAQPWIAIRDWVYEIPKRRFCETLHHSRGIDPIDRERGREVQGRFGLKPQRSGEVHLRTVICGREVLKLTGDVPHKKKQGHQ